MIFVFWIGSAEMLHDALMIFSVSCHSANHDAAEQRAACYTKQSAMVLMILVNLVSSANRYTLTAGGLTSGRSLI